MSQLSPAQVLAAGVHAPPTIASGFATTQAAWRFYSNDRVALPALAQPLVDHALRCVPEWCDHYTLVALDWCNLHFNGHGSKADRVALSMKKDLGYEMLTALAVSDRDGAPIAPLCLELRAGDGLHTTRCPSVQRPASSLDALEPVMDHVVGLGLAKPPVFIVDREADSVAHYRRWGEGGKKFVIRADDGRVVTHGGAELSLREVAGRLRGQFKASRTVLYQGRPAEQFVAEAAVVLARPARQHRVGKDGRKRHKTIPGPAMAMRLAVAEVRGPGGKVLARWLLLSNLPSGVPASTIALWYYWRWRAESYHKLLKSAGQQVEQWLQETARSLVRRLLVTAMSVALVWRIARDDSPETGQLRDTLVKLSGRQMKRGKGSRGFTEPALLAGLGVLVQMVILLESMSAGELKSAARDLMPLIKATLPKPKADTG